MLDYSMSCTLIMLADDGKPAVLDLEPLFIVLSIFPLFFLQINMHAHAMSFYTVCYLHLIYLDVG